MTLTQAEAKAKRQKQESGEEQVIFRDTRQKVIERFGEYGVLGRKTFEQWNYEHHVLVKVV